MIVRNSRDIGALIRERRVAIGLDQQALAERTGVQRLWVVQVEGGKPGARLELVLRALEVLGLELHVLDRDREGTPPEIPDIDGVVERAKGVEP